MSFLTGVVLAALWLALMVWRNRMDDNALYWGGLFIIGIAFAAGAMTV